MEKPVEFQALDLAKEKDGDAEYLKGSSDYVLDVAHYTLTKTYAVAIKCPQFFNAVKELKAEGFTVEPQIDFQNEKLILLTTRQMQSGDEDALQQEAEEQQDR